MNAFLFTIALFIYWALIGFAGLSIFKPHLRIIQSILIAPTLGVAITILPVFYINRAGFPVNDFGLILTLGLAIIAVAIIAINRPLFPTRKLFPYMALLVGALLLTASPMLNYEFDWVSFSNDDMANYSLGAQRFLYQGFFDRPNLEDLFAGKDYSLTYWFMHAAGGARAGSELMLATVWAVTGLNAHQVFMPVIMALHLSLVAAVGAMVASKGSEKRTPLIAMVLTALSPLTSLGALYQLIGQVGGLAMLTTALTLMCRPSTGRTNAKKLIGSVPAAIIIAAIFVWYPEVLPFLGLGWLTYFAMTFRKDKAKALRIAVSALLVGVLVLVALNRYLIAALAYMLNQTAGGMQTADLSSVLFPYFLVPSGLAVFWGLMPIAGDISTWLISVFIAGAILLFYWLFRFAIRRQIEVVSVPVGMLMVMMTMSLLLFFRNNDFGLFKIAMFAQPYLAGVLACELGRLDWLKTSFVKKIGICIVAVPVLLSQYGYVAKSTGEIFGGLNEIPRASAQKINRQFQNLMESIRGKNPNGYIADASNIVLAKFQSLYSRGESLIFPSRNFFINIVDFAVKDGTDVTGWSEKFLKLKKSQFVEHQVETRSGPNKFVVPAGGEKDIAKKTLITTVEQQTIFNGAHAKKGGEYFQYINDPSNQLVFVHSELGNHYYFGDRRRISFYQLENDPMFPGQKFSSLGEHLLFLALAPTDRPRVVMELTDTVVKQFGSELPTPKVQDVVLNFLGRGTGRIYSEPLQPTYIDDIPFISVDMQRAPKQFPSSTKGLMLLYGRGVPADQRRLTSFGRDISLVSEEEYQRLIPPVQLRNFPEDLSNKNLEYSGIYEDGWISERAFFVLSKNEASTSLTVAGTVPQIDDVGFKTILSLRINGKEVASKTLSTGAFEINVPVSRSPGEPARKRLDLIFSRSQQLPGADGRITGGIINFIGFK